MNPLLKKNLDPSTMSEQERKLFEMYGKKPVKNVLSNMQKERKYFDSGDYAMHKAGVSSDLGGRPLAVGTAIPTPEGLPHASPPSLSSSPTNSSISPPGPHPVQSPQFNNPFTQSASSHSQMGGGSATSSNPLLQPAAHHASLSFGKPDHGVGVGVGSNVGMPIPGGGRSDPRRSPPTSFSPLSSTNMSVPAGLGKSGNVPPSSFPIQHAHQHRESMSMSSGSGGSPVRFTSGQMMGGRNEQAVDDEEGMEMD